MDDIQKLPLAIKKVSILTIAFFLLFVVSFIFIQLLGIPVFPSPYLDTAFLYITFAMMLVWAIILKATLSNVRKGISAEEEKTDNFLFIKALDKYSSYYITFMLIFILFSTQLYTRSDNRERNILKYDAEKLISEHPREISDICNAEIKVNNIEEILPTIPPIIDKLKDDNITVTHIIYDGKDFRRDTIIVSKKLPKTLKEGKSSPAVKAMKPTDSNLPYYWLFFGNEYKNITPEIKENRKNMLAGIEKEALYSGSPRSSSRKIEYPINCSSSNVILVFENKEDVKNRTLSVQLNQPPTEANIQQHEPKDENTNQMTKNIHLPF